MAIGRKSDGEYKLDLLLGPNAIGYGSVLLGPSRSVPDEFRELAEKEL